MSKVRKLLEAVRAMAEHLNDEEVSDICEVLLRAAERLENEQEEANGRNQNGND